PKRGLEPTRLECRLCALGSRLSLGPDSGQPSYSSSTLFWVCSGIATFLPLACSIYTRGVLSSRRKRGFRASRVRDVGMNSKPFFTKTRLLGFAMVGLLSLGAMRLLAQDADQQGSPDPGYQEQGQPLPDNDINYNGDPQQDPPSRVARLSYIDGSVSFQPGGQGEWGAATRNRPVTIGDKIWSDNNARA